MTKELARYFVKLIAEDLQFSFNGMSIPSYSCEWLENQLIQGNYDEVEDFIKKRYAEHENASKKKRKFRAMTNAEFCKTYAGEKDFDCSNCSLFYYYYIGDCELAEDWSLISEKPYKTKDDKYILVEVKE